MKLISATKSVRNDNYVMNTPHKHKDFYEIYFLTKGTRFFSIENFSYKLEPNSIIAVPIGINHSTSGYAHERYVINVFTEVLNQIEQKLIDKLLYTPITVSQPVMDKIKSCIDMIISLDEKPDSLRKIKTVFSFIMFLIENEIDNSNVEIKIDSKQKTPLFLFEITDYINNNLDKDLTLEALARQVSFSPVYIRKQFKRYMKENLSDYILHSRINKVKYYLWNSHKSINEIATLCGFSSANYLTLIFTKKEKMSPSAFRKIHFPRG